MVIWAGVQEGVTLDERKRRKQRGKGEGAVLAERFCETLWFSVRALDADHLI